MNQLPSSAVCPATIQVVSTIRAMASHSQSRPTGQVNHYEVIGKEIQPENNAGINYF